MKKRLRPEPEACESWRIVCAVVASIRSERVERCTRRPRACVWLVAACSRRFAEKLVGHLEAVCVYVASCAGWSYVAAPCSAIICESDHGFELDRLPLAQCTNDVGCWLG